MGWVEVAPCLQCPRSARGNTIRTCSCRSQLTAVRGVRQLIMAKRPRTVKGSPVAEKTSGTPSPATTNSLPSGLNTATDLRHAAERLTLAASRPEDFFQANEGIAQVRMAW